LLLLRTHRVGRGDGAATAFIGGEQAVDQVLGLAARSLAGPDTVRVLTK
jgi:hypothetical protein